ncbi:hypothetical protein ACFVZH_37150 [Streptomyces sp. NPDC059534]|uniref:hypothetical protein n=1 Tax=Streptomyces sp. NPDC059534 TaxID=3346859 RepID=UPI0036962F71
MSRRRTSRTADATGLVPGPAAPLSDATAGVAVGDQVAQAANRAAAVAGDIAPDPFAPEPLDPEAVTGTPQEQLAVVTAALHRAKATAAGSARAARVRLTIELGAALGIALDRDLYKAAGYLNVESYAEAEVDLNRQYIYELIADSKRIRTVMAAGLSEFSDNPPPASHAKVLAPIVAQEDGPTRAQEVVADAKVNSKKITAAALTAAAKRLGYTTSRPALKTDDGQEDEQRRRAEAGLKLTGAADLAARALAQYEAALALGVIPDDPERAAADLARLNRIGRTLAKQNRLPGAASAPPPRQAS